MQKKNLKVITSHSTYFFVNSCIAWPPSVFGVTMQNLNLLAKLFTVCTFFCGLLGIPFSVFLTERPLIEGFLNEKKRGLLPLTSFFVAFVLSQFTLLILRECLRNFFLSSSFCQYFWPFSLRYTPNNRHPIRQQEVVKTS